MEAIRTYFDFTKAEFRGILVLICLILFLILARFGLQYYRRAEEDRHLLEQRNLVGQQLAFNSTIAEESMEADEKQDFERKPEFKPEKSGALHSFDPNKAGPDELLDLGFKEYQIKNIINFRNAGGVFHRKEDLKKLYTIKDPFYNRISPYVSIFPLQVSANIPMPATKAGISADLVEINRADTTALKTLKGIGSYLARKIVERREKLGGFVDLEQLLEIYRLSPEVLLENKSRLSLDASGIKKININEASIDDLRRHPYLNYKTASAIFNYRKQHGPFTAIKEISNSVLITDSLCRKIAPYFSIGP